MSLPLKAEVTWQTLQRSWLVQQELEVLPLCCTYSRMFSVLILLFSEHSQWAGSSVSHQQHRCTMHRCSVLQSCADNFVSLCASLLQTNLAKVIMYALGLCCKLGHLQHICCPCCKFSKTIPELQLLLTALEHEISICSSNWQIHLSMVHLAACFSPHSNHWLTMTCGHCRHGSRRRSAGCADPCRNGVHW